MKKLSGADQLRRNKRLAAVVRGHLRSLSTVAWVGFGLLFLWAPLIVVVGASFDGGSRYAAVHFPPQDPSLQWFFAISPSLISALKLSVLLGLVAALFACILGILAALGLVRSSIRGKTVIGAIFRAPMQIPAIVTGVAFLHLYYWLGDATGVSLPGTFVGLAIGHIFVATPYAIGTIVAILQRFDQTLEEAALSLGANRWSTFWQITFPMIKPGVYAGALYSFMVSFSDVPVSIFLTAPGYVTFPVELFFSMETDINPASLAAATLVIIGSFAAMLFVQWIVGLDTFMRSMSGR
jgi:putative spermidine/putrescine transport system permease protein